MSSNTHPPQARVAVVGVGWWSQGWHLKHLDQHPGADLVAIVDTAEHPQSTMNPNLQPLSILAKQYGCKVYHSLAQLLSEEQSIDGILLATPHATHYALGQQVLDAGRPIAILMEKPMTTVLDQAIQLHRAVQEHYPQHGAAFLVNHSANYQPQARKARELVTDQRGLGQIQFVSAFFASPLQSIFDDPAQKGWNEPSEGMLGNGFAWGQMTHLLAWIFHVAGGDDDSSTHGSTFDNSNDSDKNWGLQPQHVTCRMKHSPVTGADVALSATITCTNGAVLSISGTSLLPGDAHTEPPVGKRVGIEIYGDRGALLYRGVDTDPASGKLIWVDAAGHEHVLDDEFAFEDLDDTGTGPASLDQWLRACRRGAAAAKGNKNDSGGDDDDEYYVGASCTVGLRTVETVAAFYESHHTGRAVEIRASTTPS